MPNVLPDVLKPGLRIVFCGSAVGTASARAKAYYAGPDTFWQTLHAIGLTPEQFAPAEFSRLADFGLGLTDICKTQHGADNEVGTVAFDVPGSEAKLSRTRPSFVAFNGKNAAKAALQRNHGPTAPSGR